MIAALGEALVDLIQQPDGNFKACLGGSVFNFCIGAARQGLATAYLNPLSQDRFGRQFDASLHENGVDLKAGFTSRLPTALAIVSLDVEGKASYAFHHGPVANREIDAQKIIASLPQPLALLHTGGLALIPEDIDTVITVMQHAAKRGAVLSVDANLRPIAASDLGAYRLGVMRAVRQAHIVKVSDEDLLHLGYGSDDAVASARKLFESSEVRLIALTLGAAGGALLTRSDMAQMPTPKNLAVKDTVGAGDCFHAGLIAYLAHDDKLSQDAIKKLDNDFLRNALRHAIAAASINIMRPGCDPGTWEETVAFDVA
ncbi:MAG: PfkB family carbohydrate kinase [Burkholderiales bacterium]